jgi:hypothetical protein
MQDEISTTPRAPLRKPRSGRMMLAAVLIAFAMGAVLVGWLASRGDLDFAFGRKPEAQKASLAMPAPTDSAAPQAAASTSAAAPALAPALTETRLASLEQRLARLDLQAEAASGNAARAEGLLIAFAARRMIERGAPLGYLEDQLRLRFADAQPNAVDTIIAAARQPVTLDQLAGQLEELAPSLSATPAEQSAWTKMKRELASLFVIRHDSTPSTAPENRIERARLLLVAGKVDEAIAEVERLPGAPGAAGWIAAARSYGRAQKALDLIETTAMLEPRRLKNGNGETVQQPSPLVSPAI